MQQSNFRFDTLFKGVAIASTLALLPSLAIAQSNPTPFAPYNSISGLLRLIKARDSMHPLPNNASDPLAARLHYLRMHALPFDTIDSASNDLARQQLTTIPLATSSDILGRGSKAPYAPASVQAAALPSSLFWKNLGPNNLDPPYRIYWGPWSVSGRIDALAFDPITSGTYYLGSAAGGVWKTTDSGVNWTSKFNSLPGQSVNSIAIDPLNHNIVYAGTGDNDGGDSFAFGLWKSLDGGNTWTLLGTDLPNNVGNNIFGSHTVRKVVIDPSDPSGKTILVATGSDPNGNNGGIWRTTTGGKDRASWSLRQSGFSFGNIVLDANADFTKQTLFASCDGMGIYKSVDRGISWTLSLSIPFNFDASGNFHFRVDVAASRLDPKTVYVLSDPQTGVDKTTDGGATWKQLLNPLPFNADWSQAFYDFHIDTSVRTLYPSGSASVPPGAVSSDVVYIGLIDIYQSINGGRQFNSIGQTTTNGALTHNDQHSFAVNPRNQNDMLIGNDGGVYHYVYNPQLNSSVFTGLNNTLNISQFYAVASHPTDPYQLLGGTQDNSTPHLDGDPLHWTNPGAGDGFATLMNQTDPLNNDPTKRGFLNQYCTFQGGGIIMTDDNWVTKGSATPTYANDVVGFFTYLAMDPVTPTIIYTGTQFLYTGTHVPPVAPLTLGTITWVEGATQYCARGMVGDPAPFDTTAVNFITTIAPSVNGVIYVGTDSGFVWAGAARIDGGLPRRPVSQIVISPANPNRIYVVLAGSGNFPHVWRCDDARNPRWINISGNLPRISANAISIAPHDDEQQLYVGTDLGLFITNDGGVTWKDAGSGLGFPSDTRVMALNYVPSTGFLNVATFGRGMWQLRAGNNQNYIVYLTLQNYRGSRSKIGVRAEFFLPGTVPMAGLTSPTALEIRQQNLNASGWLTMLTSASGAFDVRVKPTGFLSQIIRNLRQDSGQSISPLFFAGDCNPILDATGALVAYGDNVIDMKDVMWVTSHMGQFSTGPEDVDGDGVVTQRDLDLVMQNVGKRGN